MSYLWVSYSYAKIIKQPHYRPLDIKSAMKLNLLYTARLLLFELNNLEALPPFSMSWAPLKTTTEVLKTDNNGKRTRMVNFL